MGELLSVRTLNLSNVVAMANSFPADAFKRRMQENGKSLAGFNTGAFLNVQSGGVSPSQPPLGSTAPPAHVRRQMRQCLLSGVGAVISSTAQTELFVRV